METAVGSDIGHKWINKKLLALTLHNTDTYSKNIKFLMFLVMALITTTFYFKVLQGVH